MSEFKYVYGESLQHWGKGKEAKDHKYTAREWVKGKWQYIYDTGKSKVKEATNVIKDQTKSISNNVKSQSQKIYNISKDSVNKSIENATNKASSEIDKLKKTKDDTQKVISEKIKDVSKEVDNKVNEIKSIIEKNVKNTTSNLSKVDKEKISAINNKTAKEILDSEAFQGYSDYFDPVSLDFVSELPEAAQWALLLSGTIIPVLLGIDLIDLLVDNYNNVKEAAERKDAENELKDMENINKELEEFIKNKELLELYYDQNNQYPGKKYRLENKWWL